MTTANFDPWYRKSRLLDEDRIKTRQSVKRDMDTSLQATKRKQVQRTNPRRDEKRVRRQDKVLVQLLHSRFTRKPDQSIITNRRKPGEKTVVRRFVKEKPNVLLDKDRIKTRQSVKRDMDTSLQATKRKQVQRTNPRRDEKRVRRQDKEKQIEETTLQGSLHRILLQKAAQCIRIQPWDDEPDHIVEIEFPKMAVLGERQLGIEIMKTKDLKFESKTLLTDVIQITQSSHASFLRPVTVRIPLHQKYKKKWERTERTDKHGRKIKIENGIAHITSFVFSPVGLYYEEMKEAVHALVLRDEIDQMLHRGTVYLIVEQEINTERPALKINLRPFFSFQEHDKCRRARNVFFAPVEAEPSDTVNLNLQWDENFITSVNGNLQKDLIFRIGQSKEHQWWTGHRLRYKFQNGNKPDKILTVSSLEPTKIEPGCTRSSETRRHLFERGFKLLNMEDLESLRESAERFIPSRWDLYSYLHSIPESYGWLNFMQDCLDIKKMYFYDFVYKDVLDANKNRDPNPQIDEWAIKQLFKLHTQNGSIEKFKREVFSVSSDRLTNENLGQLAEALRYVKGKKLRKALRTGLETHSINLNGTSREFQKWLGDGDGETHLVPVSDLL